METRIEKSGNCLVLRIPRSVAAKVGITLDAVVELTPRGGQLVLSLRPRPATELENLLAGVTPENLHGEVETGASVGGEAW